VNTDDLTNTDTLVTGLEINGAAFDGSVYHTRTIWHTNGRIYSSHSTWPDLYWRIISVNTNGAVIHQYNGENTNSSATGFVILGNYVYVWVYDNAYLAEPYSIKSKSHVIKLTLDLEYVCEEPCLGGLNAGKYYETGRCIVSDGSKYMYNYSAYEGGHLSKWWNME